MKSFEAPRPPPASTDLPGALHEVSNALTVVMGWIDHARTLLPPGAARDALDVASAHARLGHTVARQSIGAEPSEQDDARSAVALLRDVALGLRQEATRRGVSVIVKDGDAEDQLVLSAPAALQILINLTLNALAFSPHGTTVVLGLSLQDGDMVFTVTDSGPGIPSHQAEVLFTEPGSTRPGGAGIGLRHSHSLALRHGGELSLAAHAGGGACFALRWPVGEAPSRTLNRSVPPRALDGLRLLVLEDDPAVLSLIEFGLSARGATVAAARDEGELSALLAQGVFDVALVDLSPLGERAAVLDSVFARAPGLPIIIISGSVAPDVRSRAIVAWVRKPFEVAELATAVARVAQGG